MRTALHPCRLPAPPPAPASSPAPGAAAAGRGGGAALALVAVLAAALAPALAVASKPRCRLERVDLIPDQSPPQVRVLASVVELEGAMQPLPAKAFRLVIGGKPVATAQRSVPFLKSGIDAYVVLALETSALYAKAMEPIKEAATAFVNALPPTTKVKLVRFSSEVDPGGTFGRPQAQEEAISELEADEASDTLLLSGVRDGLRALNSPAVLHPETRPAAGQPARAADPLRPPPRRLLVVLSDGIDPMMDREQFRGLGKNLHDSHVPLFPIAFSPSDERGPLLNLGELAKRSGGTFRWAEKPEVLKDRFLSLAEELTQLQVLTFADKAIDPAALAGGNVSLRCGELTAQAAALSEPLVKATSGGAWWRWVVGVLAGLAALWGVARLLVWSMDRRLRQAQPGKPGQPGYPGGAGPYPGFPPQAGASAYGNPAAHPGASAYPGFPPAGASAYPQAGVPAQPAQAAPMAPAVSSTPAVLRPTLRFIGASLSGQRVPLPDGGTLLLGKAVSGPGTLPITSDPTVSSRHAEIRRLGDAYYFTDLQSTNGSYINDQRVTAPTRLNHGDLIRIGTATECRFVME